MDQNINVPSQMRSGTISATIRRADGTIEELGIISYYHRNPLKRFAWNVKRWMIDYINKRHKV